MSLALDRGFPRFGRISAPPRRIRPRSVDAARGFGPPPAKSAGPLLRWSRQVLRCLFAVPLAVVVLFAGGAVPWHLRLLDLLTAPLRTLAVPVVYGIGVAGLTGPLWYFLLPLQQAVDGSWYRIAPWVTELCLDTFPGFNLPVAGGTAVLLLGPALLARVAPPVRPPGRPAGADRPGSGATSTGVGMAGRGGVGPTPVHGSSSWSPAIAGPRIER